jgi:predicted nucleic acid-binding Zn ribbon protein
MPVYVYRRSDGSTFEFEQRITAEPLTTCPISAQRVERVLQPFSVRYTGTGFYLTDHPRGSREREPAPATEKEL